MINKTLLLMALVASLSLSNIVEAKESSYDHWIAAAKRLDNKTESISQTTEHSEQLEKDQSQEIERPVESSDSQAEPEQLSHEQLVKKLADQKPNIYDTNSSLKAASAELMKAFAKEEKQ